MASSVLGGVPARPIHTVLVEAEPFHVDVRYTGLVYIARGAYGMVASADDRVSCPWALALFCRSPAQPLLLSLAVLLSYWGVYLGTADRQARRDKEDWRHVPQPG